MRKLFNRKGAVKVLAAILAAGMIVSGISVSPKADDSDPNYLAWAASVGDVYEDLDGDGVDDGYESYLQAQADAQAAAEEAARQQAAAEEAARQQAAAEEAARQQAAAEEAARQQAAAEEAARQQAAAEEAARQQAAAEEAARQQAAAEEAARQQAAAEEAARLAAEQAAQPVKRDTPQAGNDLYNGHRFTNLPEYSEIIIPDFGVFDCTGGNYTFSDDEYTKLGKIVWNNKFETVSITAKARNNQELDSDTQTFNITTDDFPIPQKTKRATPSASFEASTSVLSNLDTAAYSLDGGATWSEAIYGQTTLNGVHADMDILIKNMPLTDDQAESDIQTIFVSKADKPNGVVGQAVSSIGGTGSLAHVSSDEEYCVSGTGNWQAIGGETVTGLAAGNYDVRVKAHGNLLASDTVTVTIDPFNSKKEATPNASFDGTSLNLYPVSVGMAYCIDGSNWTTITDNAASHVTFTRDQIKKAIYGQGIWLKKLGNGSTTTDSDVQTIKVYEASKPENIKTTNATNNGANGSIQNVANDMQYSTDQKSWIDIGSNTINGVKPGTYYIRRRAQGAMIASETVSVNVGNNSGSKNKENTPSASFNAQNMTLSGIDGCQISLDGGCNYSGTYHQNDVVLSENDVKADKGIYVKKIGNGNDTCDSDTEYIKLSKQSIPSGITAVSATSKTLGIINGVNSMMECRAAGSSSWVTPNGNSIPNLPAGTYYIRTKGAYTALPSDYLAVVIQQTTNATTSSATTTPQIIVSPTTDSKTDTTAKKDSTTKADSGIVVDKSKIEEAEKEAEAAAEEAVADEEKAKAAEEAAIAASEAATAAENGESQTATGEPILMAGGDTVAGWGAIEGQMSAEKTEPVVVDMTQSSTVVPATTIAAAATTNTELVLAVSGDMAWSIEPSQIVTAGQDIDLGIKENTQNIPTEKIASIETDGVVEKQFTINHSGDFGFTANLTISLNPEDAGKTARLFWYNEDSSEMELVDYAVIQENGDATFALTHASSYAVSVAKTAAASATEDDTAAATTKSTDETSKKSSGAWIFIVIAVLVLAVAIIAVLAIKKKKEEEARRRHHLQQNHPNGIHHTGDGQHNAK